MSVEDTTFVQCVKVSELRKKGYADLRRWIDCKDNMYVGRHGRIWIHGAEKEMFHYKRSKWANPFKVTKDLPVEKSLELYREYLKTSGLINDINELKNKTIGCWCSTDKCHAVVLKNILSESCK